MVKCTHGGGSKEEIDAAFEYVAGLCRGAKLTVDLMNEVDWFPSPTYDYEVEEEDVA